MYKTRLKMWGASRNRKKLGQQSSLVVSHASARESFPLPAVGAHPDMNDRNSHGDSGDMETPGNSETQGSPQCGSLAMNLCDSMPKQRRPACSEPSPSTSEDIGVTTPRGTSILTPTGSDSSQESQPTGIISNDTYRGTPIANDTRFHPTSTNEKDQSSSVWYNPDDILEWLVGANRRDPMDIRVDRFKDTPLSARRGNSCAQAESLVSGSSSEKSFHDRKTIEAKCVFAFPTSNADPGLFIHLCLLSCTLHFESRHKDADEAATQASRTYGQLVWQNHRHALTSLNAVMIILLKYTKERDAIDLVAGARRAALEQLGMDHPLVRTIDYMEFQAGGQYAAVQVDQLLAVYESFCSMLTPRHPHSLVAGYELAWRLSIDSKAEKDQLAALQLLDKIETDSDRTLGARHLHSIAILMTKSRVLQALQLVSSALKVMSEAVDRIRSTYSPQHPYHLEARARYAPLLFSAYRDDEAESEWVAAALGRVELLGREHSLSEESILEVEDFYCTVGRQSQAIKFRAELVEAELRYLRRRPELKIPHVDLIQ